MDQPKVRKFKKKPVEIEAVQNIWPIIRNGEPQWLVQAMSEGIIIEPHIVATKTDPLAQGDGHLIIKTLYGDMRCDRNDWIIRGVKGELYPCKPDIFAATYDPVL